MNCFVKILLQCSTMCKLSCFFESVSKHCFFLAGFDVILILFPILKRNYCCWLRELTSYTTLKYSLTNRRFCLGLMEKMTNHRRYIILFSLNFVFWFKVCEQLRSCVFGSCFAWYGVLFLVFRSPFCSSFCLRLTCKS